MVRLLPMYQTGVKKITAENRWIPKIFNPFSKKSPRSKRSTFRILAPERLIPKSTLHDTFKVGDIVRRTKSLMSLLTNQIKYDRMIFSFLFIRRMRHENKVLLTTFEK